MYESSSTLSSKPTNDYSWAVSSWLSEVGLQLDRSSDMPVGLQLVWGLRAAIGRGTLQPGERLPALRELAQDLGVNLNTMRAVVARLAQEGLLVARHGSGTFVAADPPRQPGLDAVLSTARNAAVTAGISPRELAVALWAADGGEIAADEEATARRRVREEIGALERLLAHHTISAASPGPNEHALPAC